MTAEQFTYWLNGFFEIQNPKTLDETQTQIIKDHLSLVFKKVTPDRYDSGYDILTTRHSCITSDRLCGINIPEHIKLNFPPVDIYC